MFEVGSNNPNGLRKCYHGRVSTVDEAKQLIAKLIETGDQCIHPNGRAHDIDHTTLQIFGRTVLGGESL